jgi:hypothetical protein
MLITEKAIIVMPIVKAFANFIAAPFYGPVVYRRLTTPHILSV